MQASVAFLARRVIAAVLTVIGAMVLLFVMVRLVPGDAASVLLGPRATPDLRAQIETAMGLDQGLPMQVWLFFSHALQGDFGEDIISRRPILHIVAEVLPNTLILAFSAMALALAVGIPLGLIATVKRGS